MRRPRWPAASSGVGPGVSAAPSQAPTSQAGRSSGLGRGNINARNKRGQSPLMMAMGEDAPARMTPDLGYPSERSTELLLRTLGAKDFEAEAVSPRRDEERPSIEIPALKEQK